ncbi:MAG: glutamate--tRNA ligase, partial [Planctomycetia bacterium]|nr:glutamate--tRNA ligase [Planctomycetia bacterium]
FVIARTDGTPVYNLVVVVDDHDMGITHVIRGEDHIANTPKQIIIYDALKYTKPIFAHLPMILGPDKKRLSKRHGATGVQEYRDKGILPEALTNYLALLGWNPGTEQELFITDTSDLKIAELEKLANEFSIDRVQKKSAVFDEKKLEWMNKQYIKNTPVPKLYIDIKSLHKDWVLSKKDNKYLFEVIKLMKERVTTIHDFVTKTEYFFTDPAEYEEKAVRKRWKNKSVNELIDKYSQKLNGIYEWNVENIERSLRDIAESENITAGKIIHPTRLALSGMGSGPSLFDMIELLGKETCIRRLQKAINVLPL